MSVGAFALHALMALALGTLIGLERQWHRRLADLKTSALVCFGACVFMIAAGAQGPSDPAHMAGQIVVGVGFIGAGLLFREGTQTRGLNTAATLWCSAAVGVLTGSGQEALAALAAALLVFANVVLRRVARQLDLRMGFGDAGAELVQVDVECEPARAGAVRSALDAQLVAAGADVRSRAQARTAHGNVLVSASVTFENADAVARTEQLVRAVEGLNVVAVSWRRT